MKSYIFSAIGILLLSSALLAGDIHGIIRHAGTGLALKNVIVKLESRNLTVSSNASGEFLLEGLLPGKYYLQFMADRFYTLVMPDVEIKGDHPTQLNVEMYPGNPGEYLFLEVGGIRVTANRELISQNPETIQQITSGEIEHMQANSLIDVLDRLPGNARTKNLGLQTRQQITLRTFNNAGADAASLFGTKVVVDDIPQTTNADLNVGTGVGYGSKVSNGGTGGSQYDLREVVAENIEKVQVMSGASSVEYGDNSQGVIVVKTRSQNVPTRLKLRSNPDTREANMMGGFNALNTNFVYNFNYGYSERDIRVSGDEYHRITGQLKASNLFWNKKLALDQSLNYGRRIEEDNDDSDPQNTRAYNRDYKIQYAQIFDFNPDNISNYYWRNYLTYRRRNSWVHKRETSDLAYLTDRITPGTREGILGNPSYFSDVTTTGEEWSLGSKFKLSRNLFWGETLHNLLAGWEFQYDRNNGAGKQFAILRPPSGNQGIRPRRFDDIPGQTQVAFFAEDRITGRWMLPYTIILGFRLESYNPREFKPGKIFSNQDVFGASQGTFFNPLIGMKLALAPHTQFRLTYNRASKVPALAQIYPEDFYLDVYDYTYRPVDDGNGGTRDSMITLVTTSILNRQAPQLHGYQNSKFEIGLDHQIDDFGFSLIAYHQKTEGIPKDIYVPFMYSKYYWPHWPSDSDKQISETYTTDDSKYKRAYNVNWTLDRGIEFYFRTHRIRPLNMIFKINAAYKHKTYGGDNYPLWGTTRSYQKGDTLNSGWVVPEDMQLIPYYKPYQSWRQQLVINYNVDYIAKSLGIWFTLRAQQVLLEQDLEKDNPVRSAQGFYRNGEMTGIDPQTSYLMELDRSYSDLDVTVDRSKTHPKWLFGVNVSKQIFKGAEISVFIDNILNDRAYYLDRTGNYRSRNPEIFWGMSFSSRVDDWF